MPGSMLEFQRSITQELNSVKNRVRNLIGNAHWGEEGRFKEVVLKNVIRKFLPNNLSVATGFIIKSDEFNDTMLSRQLDIIVYDNTLPVLFSEGDFIITTSSNVRGIIEVKSRINHNTLETVLEQFDNSIRDFWEELNTQERPKIFTGIFSFEFNGDKNSDRIDQAIQESEKIVNHISLGTNLFIKKWKRNQGPNLNPTVITDNDFYNIYEIDHLSFSYFISNLIDTVCGGLDDRNWFSYPIEGTKERRRLRTIHMDN